ncbi:MAG: nucleotidyltransferase domain-containing protein [Verrucomicrobia bacterium]|nr:nucleotidyltransferase domain-containing protein [Verrucomicrobiota bacterium]
MNSSTTENVLPAQVEQVLNELLNAAKSALAENLRSVVLFGSAADGQMRATSDVNLILVLARFDRTQVDRIREPLRMAHAAARVSAMFVLEAELPVAAEAFAVKFADIGRRRRVLFGEDVFARLTPSREAQIQRLKQVLVNLTLRLRSRYALVSLREEQLALVLADAAGPLRAAAAAILEVEGQPVASAKAALATIASSLGVADDVLAQLSQARETRTLPAGVAGTVLFGLLELAEKMRGRVERLGDYAA